MRSVLLATFLFLGAVALTGQSWAGVGPPGGELDFIAVAPSTPTIIYASSRLGGVFRSLDGGETFDPTVEGLPTEQVQCLAVSPSDSRTIYAGTASGAFKSTDSGKTWTALGGGFPAGVVNSLLVDPSNASTVYAAGTGGTLAKSTDAGATWNTIGGSTLAATSPRVLAIAAAPTSTLFLGTLQGGGFFRSADGGSTWTAENDGFLTIGPQVLAIAADPTNPSVVYAAVGSDVYVSTQGGGKWQLNDYSAGFTNGIASLAVDASGVAYAADQLQFYLRAPTDSDWTPLPGGDDFVNSIAVGPSPAPPAYLAHGRAGLSEGGVDLWQGGSSFAFSFANAESVSALAADPQQTGRWLAGTTGGVIEYVANRSQPWQGGGGAVGIATDILFDTRTSGLVYVSTAAGIFKSSDAGLTFVTSGNGLPSTLPPTVVRALLAQPGTGAAMLAGTSKGLYQSADGANWAVGSADLSARQIFGLSSDPHGASTVWAGTDDGVYRSTNAGANFSKAGVTGNVHKVLASQAGRVYAAADSGLFASSDGGTTWASVPGVTAPVVALDEDTATGAVFAGTTGSGIFQSTDGGTVWTAQSTGLLNPVVQSLAVNDGTLLAGTNGGSAFSLNLTVTSSREPVTRISTTPATRVVSPRP
jgi:photosystem II stability/assembly factor-like uncharacterized protein